MRAIGARRRQVAGVYLRTALLFGALARSSASGSGSCSPTCSPRYFGSMFWAIHVGFGVDPTVLVVSVAGRPRSRRRSRRCPRSAAASASTCARRSSPPDPRSAARTQATGCSAAQRFLPRTMQIGLRGLGRRQAPQPRDGGDRRARGRQPAGGARLAAAATENSRASWANHLEDVRLWTSGRELFDARALHTIEIDAGRRPGAARARQNDAELAGEEAFVWGVPRQTALPLPAVRRTLVQRRRGARTASAWP